MNIRPITENDVERFFHMLCQLDEETDFMMYEPGERLQRTKSLEHLKGRIESAVSGTDLLLVAEDEHGTLAGFIWAERGALNRIAHTAYIVIGVRLIYRHQGIGTSFFRRLDDWARKNDIVRLELIVECDNIHAKTLYEKQGFSVEGVRPKFMLVNGSYVDEYYMGKILG